MNGSRRAVSLRVFGLLLVAVGMLTGCQIAGVSTYDAQTDQGVTQLQQAIDRHLSSLELLAAEPSSDSSLVQRCDPNEFADTYRELNARLRTLVLRNEARDQNELTVAQLGLLKENLAKLHEQQMLRHSAQTASPKERCLGAGQIEVNRSSLEQIIRAILRLELAKRDFRKGE